MISGALVTRRNVTRVLLPLLALFAVAVSIAPRGTHAAQADVLILRSSVGVPNGMGVSIPPEASPEVLAVTAMGLTYDLVTDAQWASMTQAQFAAYKAIVIGDNGCIPAVSDAPFGANGTAPDPNFPDYFGYPGTGVLTRSANVWGPITTGNTIVIGTDPSTHVYQPNGQNMNVADLTSPASMWKTSGGKMLYGGIAFAADQSGYTGTHTGLYVALGCRYEGFPDLLGGSNPTADPGWGLYQSQVVANSSRGVYAHVPWLAGIHDGDSITVDGTAGWASGGYNVAELVADHPAFNQKQPYAPMTDDDVTGWSTSVHAAIQTWAPYDPVNDPRGWIVLAMATDFQPAPFTANNGHVGSPYIIVRGNGVVPRTDLSIPGGCVGANCSVPHTETGQPYQIVVRDSAVCPAGSAPGSVPQYVTFTVTGPNGPLTSGPVLVVNNQASWSYTGSHPGTDTVSASNVDCKGNVESTPLTPVTWYVPGAVIPQILTFDSVTGDQVVVTGQDYSDRKNLKSRLFDGQNCQTTSYLSCAPIAGQPVSFTWDGSPLSDVTCTLPDLSTPAVPAAPPCVTDANGWVYFSVNHTGGPSDAITGRRDHRLAVGFAGTATILPASQTMPYTVTLDPTSTAITSMPTAPLSGNNTWAVTARTVDDCSTFDDPVACANGNKRPVVMRTVEFTITGGNLTSPYTTHAGTDSNGYATIQVPLPAGVYQVTARFNGDSFYKASEASAPTTVIAYRPTCFSIWGGDTDQAKVDSLTGIARQATLADSQANAANKVYYEFWGDKWVQGDNNKDGQSHPGVIGNPQTFTTTNSTYQAHMDFKGCVWSTGHQGGDGRIAWGLQGFPAWTTDPGTSSFPPPQVDSYIGVIVTCTTDKSNHDDIGDVCGLVVLHVENYAALGNGRLALPGSIIDISGGLGHADSGHPGFGQVVAVVARR